MSESHAGGSGGLISVFVRHPTASNLLMAAMIVIGLFSLARLNTQFFPTLEIPTITVSVVWPGASAEDVEENILDALEPELRFLDDLEKVTSYAREGSGRITLEFKANADMQKAMSDVEQGVAQVDTLPDDSETPKVTRVAFYERVAKVSVSGPFEEAVIKAYAKRLRDAFLAAGIDRVTLEGARDEEIWIRVRESDLQRLDLSLSDIAQKVRANTRDQPSGVIEGDFEMQLRSLSDRKTPDAIGKIEVRSNDRGERILLRDISDVGIAFDRDQPEGEQAGGRAIELSVQRAVTADTLKTLATTRTVLDEVLPTLPSTLNVRIYDVSGERVSQRIGILVKNGAGGLLLVLVILFVFLNARIAFWVAAGIPVAMLAAFSVMWATGQTINMVSLFAFIMMLGIIVDDAIVVGEHTATRQELGDSRLEAAERGATTMLKPVMAASLTTVAAFMPIFLIRDRIGDIMEAIPLVVIAVLIASLIECFLILPGHLRHGFGAPRREPSRFRRAFDDGFARFRDGPFGRFSDMCYRWRYTTVAFTVATLIIAIGVVAGGRVKFVFFPSPEPENISAYVEFSPGTPRDEQRRALQEIEASLSAATDAVAENGEKLVVAAFTTIGKSGSVQGDNVAQIGVQLTASEVRETPTRDIIRAWRKVLPQIPGVERIALQGRRGGPPGRDIDVELKDAPAEDLKAAANELKQALTAYPGVSAISDDLPYGKPELVLTLTPRGAALGFTGQSIGEQIRNAFEGAIATRFARGEEEITVRVMRRQEVPGPQALRNVYLKSPDGLRVPLDEVVALAEKVGFSVVNRKDGVRNVSVRADVDTQVTTNADVIAKIDEEVMPGLKERYGLQYAYSGRAEERTKSFADLQSGALLALVIIYIILAWVFESYTRPFAVMAIIPFGLVGAIIGHMVMGINLTILSIIGLLGLSGILVNDSIILVSQISDRLRAGNSLREAAVGASRDRLRAVLLTSLTTICGLLPLLFETSRQAQFLMPMAVTVVFGLATATLLVLILVPALVGIGGDLGHVGGALLRLVGLGSTSPQPVK